MNARRLGHLHLAVLWRWESEHPSVWTIVLPCRSFQAKKRLISVGLAERMVLVFGRDAKNFPNSVRSEHFCFEYVDWREALLSCSKRLSVVCVLFRPPGRKAVPRLQTEPVLNFFRHSWRYFHWPQRASSPRNS